MLKQIVIAPDSFKGTIDADEICEIEKRALLRRFPDAAIHCLPLSDGGEGLVESYLRIVGGERVTATVTGPHGRPVSAAYGLLDSRCAVIEIASCAGLPLMGEHRDPLHATTRGVGELLLDARQRGVKRVILGLGGSATNDCGIGMASALGFRFFDRSGAELKPLAENLGKIERIEEPHEPLGLELLAACDVNNPLLGETGATYTFGPQKGADASMLALLEQGMSHFAQVLAAHYGDDLSTLPGTGAAGGLGMAAVRLFGGTLRSGIDLLLDAAQFNETIRGSDLVLTGEGRIDWQSAHGKVVSGVASRCRAQGVPCIALCGSIGKGADVMYDCGITAIFSSVCGASTFAGIQQSCRDDLEQLADAVARMLALLPMKHA